MVSFIFFDRRFGTSPPLLRFPAPPPSLNGTSSPARTPRFASQSTRWVLTSYLCFDLRMGRRPGSRSRQSFRQGRTDLFQDRFLSASCAPSRPPISSLTRRATWPKIPFVNLMSLDINERRQPIFPNQPLHPRRRNQKPPPRTPTPSSLRRREIQRPTRRRFLSRRYQPQAVCRGRSGRG